MRGWCLPIGIGWAYHSMFLEHYRLGMWVGHHLHYASARGSGFCHIGKVARSLVALSAESVIEISIIKIVVVVVGRHSARTDIGMPVNDGGIRASIGFLVDTVKARGGTASRGTRRGVVI